VIDAKDVFFVEDLEDFVVQRESGFEVAAEGLLENYPGPAFVVMVESGGAQSGNNRRRQRCRGGNVKEAIVRTAGLAEVV
jgi:hypothetical protein